jgi:hypothetical protein
MSSGRAPNPRRMSLVLNRRRLSVNPALADMPLLSGLTSTESGLAARGAPARSLRKNQGNHNAEKLVRDPYLSIRQQFAVWSRRGARRITLADEIGVAFASDAQQQVELDESMSGGEPTPKHANAMSRFLGGELSGRFAPEDVAKPVAVRPIDGAGDDEEGELPPDMPSSGSRLFNNGDFSPTASSAFSFDSPRGQARKTRRLLKTTKDLSHRQRRMTVQLNLSISQSSTDSDSPPAVAAGDEEADETNQPATKATRAKRKTTTISKHDARARALTHAEKALLEAASVRLSVTTVIARLKQEVDEMATLQDCTVFVPFLVLFLASFLLSVDITQTHYVVRSLYNQDTDGRTYFSNTEDLALQQLLKRGDALYDSNVATPAPTTNHSSNASILSSTPTTTAPAKQSWADTLWDVVPGRDLLAALGLDTLVTIGRASVRDDRHVLPFVDLNEPVFMRIRSAADFMKFFNEVFVPSNWPCDEGSTDFTNRVSTRLGSTLLLGAARLRVLRMRPDSCRVNTRMFDPTNGTAGGSVGQATAGFFSDDSEEERQYKLFTQASIEDQSIDQHRCYAPYDSDGVEKRPFCNHRNPMTENVTMFEYEECSIIFDEMERSRYPCAGYVIDLPFNASCQSVRDLTDLIFPKAYDAAAGLP